MGNIRLRELNGMKAALLISLAVCLPVAWACISNNNRPSPTTTKKPTSSSCKCGVSKSRSNRIVGGQNADKNEYPWQVMILKDGRAHCGGSVISSRTILTAAHCNGSSNFEVLVREHDLSKSDGEERISIVSFVNHPSYNVGAKLNNDIAIITLTKDISFDDNVYPICLPSFSGSFYDNVDAVASGWGSLSSGGAYPNILQEVNIRTMSNSRCSGSGYVYQPSQITDTMICANAAGKDSCQGDSGGPLVYKTLGGYFEQVGVTSWGYGCASSDAPGVYARVTEFNSWVQGKMRGSTCPRPSFGY